MKKKTLILSAGFALLALIALFGFNYFTVSAQTMPTPTPVPIVRPSATPVAAPNVTPTPQSGEVIDDDEPIKIDTDLVNLNVRVVDRNNRPVGSLSKQDFKVYEDNVLQNIEFFSKAEVPTNYALVIDNSGSLRHQLEKVIEASKIIVGTNRKDDETSVIRFVSSDTIEVVQDFTANKNYVNEALDNLFIEGGQTAIIDAIYLAAEKTAEYEKSRNPNDKKRRALILVSDGEDRDSFYKEQQLFELLRESDVQIYAVGFINELSKEGGFIGKSPQGKAKAFLERLATETGGKVYFPNNISELNQIANDISAELRTQYLVSYSPTNEMKDGRFKNIRVNVADGPNKEKRIAITRSGRLDGATTKQTSAPSLQNQTRNPQQ